MTNIEEYKAVGALIKKNDKFLLIKRKKKPYGYACLAGHVDNNETYEQALFREVKEESNLHITKYKKVFKGKIDGKYSTNGRGTYLWELYLCETKGKIFLDESEAESIGFYSKEEIKNLDLGQVWQILFKKINFFNNDNI
jgi:ADP-ribose pyrophosphatase YjhB (NUDIX family)